MTRKERYDYVLKYFREQMPEVQTELEFSSVFQLLVAVILSAQCTDKRINQVTPEICFVISLTQKRWRQRKWRTCWNT